MYTQNNTKIIFVFIYIYIMFYTEVKPDREDILTS